MPVIALWSAPRARSTAFYRSMLQRGDLVALHEPFCNVMDHGETDVDGRSFTSVAALLAWLRDETDDRDVFLKDTTDRRHPEVLADRRFLAEARHGFLIRSPEQVAASFHALRPEMRRHEIGLEALHEHYRAVRDAGGHTPIVIDSDDLVARPGATMAAFCEAVGLPFRADALRWEPSDREEWRRTSRWHVDVGDSTGFRHEQRSYEVTVASSEKLADWAAHHRPFYEALRSERLAVTDADEPPDPGT